MLWFSHLRNGGSDFVTGFLGKNLTVKLATVVAIQYVKITLLSPYYSGVILATLAINKASCVSNLYFAIANMCCGSQYIAKLFEWYIIPLIATKYNITT